MSDPRGRLPDFVVIGVGKCGTTSLFNYLCGDDRVFIPEQKELNYFSEEGQLDELRPEYSALFAQAAPSQLCGDVSPRYMHSLNMGDAPRRIREMIPDAPLVCLLRDPIQRAFSSYRFRHMWGFYEDNTPPTFEDAIARDPGMVSNGVYMKQLDRYFERFPREQILVLLTDDLGSDANDVVMRVQRHIGLSPRRVVPHNPEVHLETGQRRRSAMIDRARANPVANWTLDRIPRSVRTLVYRGVDRTPLGDRLVGDADVAPMLESTRQTLRELYADSNRRLADLLERDLSHWCA